MTIKGFIASIPYLAIFAVLAVLYNVFWDNPRVAARAREGYVVQSELVALQALKDEADRQKAQAEFSMQSFKEAAEKAGEEDAKQQAILEGRIAAYAAIRSSEGRKWDLTARDLIELRGGPTP